MLDSETLTSDARRAEGGLHRRLITARLYFFLKAAVCSITRRLNYKHGTRFHVCLQFIYRCTEAYIVVTFRRSVISAVNGFVCLCRVLIDYKLNISSIHYYRKYQSCLKLLLLFHKCCLLICYHYVFLFNPLMLTVNG